MRIGPRENDDVDIEVGRERREYMLRTSIYSYKDYAPAGNAANSFYPSYGYFSWEKAKILVIAGYDMLVIGIFVSVIKCIVCIMFIAQTAITK